MRVFYFLIALAITLSAIVLLSKPFGSVPPAGSFISPQHGFWQNAEPSDLDFSGDLSFAQLENNVHIYFDERMVPHVFSENDRDAFFAQGFLHAKFRLWQMEFQIYAAAGRLSEILGAGPDGAYLRNDRNMRRMGMVYGARRSLEKMENDPDTKSQLDAYTEGVNSYISGLTTAQLPLEYRLLNYRPEKWSNLKTALFLKYMSYDLTGNESDIEFTDARDFFSEEDFNKLYPVIQDSLDPIIPRGTAFPAPSVKPVAPSGADTLYYSWKIPEGRKAAKPDRSNGSNNWAVAGSKTRSGRPILCNDPHLGLNLPSLWYEMQISTPSYNVYGVSFPGAPSVIIGFNDSIAWGVTNAARDVKDYYRIQFRDRTKQEYQYNGGWVKTSFEVESYLVKGGAAFYDTVAYTVFGPVLYDDAYNGDAQLKENTGLALRWKAHDASNELKTFSLLNRAQNYRDYENAIKSFVCPGQNFVFASKSGDIALWQQGGFPAKWYRQGDFIMPGADSAFRWQADIPQTENPHLLNPSRGYVSSANQMPADTAYPYYLGGNYDVYRGLLINRYLSRLQNISIEDMQKMQTDNYNVFAETALPILFRFVRREGLNAAERRYLEVLRLWNRRNDANEEGPVVFSVWFERLEQFIWHDELSQVKGPVERPQQYTLIDALNRDSAFTFIDNISTPAKETIEDMVTNAFRASVQALIEMEADGNLSWSKYKDAGIRHLLRLAPLSRLHLHTGGGENIINAIKQFHGPSWRMIVQLTDETAASGIYPGGQSGNPGSRFYDNQVDDWAAGRYYDLWMMKKGDTGNKKIKYVMNFIKE